MNKLTLRKFIREILLEKWTKKYKKILIVLAQKDLVKRLIAQQEKKQRGKNTKSKHPLNEIENIKEQSINNFDRINFYMMERKTHPSGTWVGCKRQTYV